MNNKNIRRFPPLKPEPSEPFSDGSTGFHRSPVRFVGEIWELGWTDGRLGRGRAQANEILTKLQGLNADEEPPVDVLAESYSNELERARQRLEQAKKSMELWTERRGREAPKYAKGTIYLWGALGVFLLLSDIAINWHVLSDAMGLLKYPALRALLCFGVVALSSVSKVFFDEWVFSEGVSSRRRMSFSLVLLVLMLACLVATTLVRTESQATVGELNRGYTTSAYLLLNVAFALAGGYMLAQCLHYWSCLTAYHETTKQYETVESELVKVERAPRDTTPPADTDATAGFYMAVYEHGFERGERAKWTLAKDNSVYAQCLRSVMRSTGERNIRMEERDATRA